MPGVVVLQPTGVDSGAGNAFSYASASDVVAALQAASGPFVLLSDGLNLDDLGAVAQKIGDGGKAVIEVRSERWDGASFSPLSAACRGVISGFGLNGVQAAVRLLEG